MCAVGTKLVAVGGASGRVALFESSAASFEPVAELRPATLARLWNAMAGPAAGAGGASRLAVRGLRWSPEKPGTRPRCWRRFARTAICRFGTSRRRRGRRR